MIGYPAGHSLSPAIHRDGYALHELEWAYDAFSVAPEDLAAFVEPRACDPAWVGLSVTAPHKESVLRFGRPDEPTALLGAGNTLVFGDQPRVHNTDVPGFVRAWREHDLPVPRSAAILGNGATARSILLALAGLGLGECVALVRDPGRAASLVALGEALGVPVATQLLDEPVGPVDLVANTIPAAATAEHAAALAGSARVVFDVVYDPWPTPLGRASADAGVASLNGLDLLAGQAVDQFYLFTGRAIDFRRARSAAERELNRRASL